MWSIGVITYVLLSGEPPFQGRDNDEIFDAIEEGKVHFPYDQWHNISQEAKDFIYSLLVLDPEERMTPLQAIKHPWIK